MLITIFVLISYNEDVRYAERVSASSIMPQTSLRRGWVVAADDLQPLFCLLAHEVVLQDIAFRTQSPHLSHLQQPHPRWRRTSHKLHLGYLESVRELSGLPEFLINYSQSLITTSYLSTNCMQSSPAAQLGVVRQRVSMHDSLSHAHHFLALALRPNNSLNSFDSLVLYSHVR